jgi:RHH-type rel operon transcriptional repressor/antitoxin RelB
MLGARCPVEWQEKIRGIAEATGRKQAEVVREAIAQYLGETDSTTIIGTLEDMQQRLAVVKRKLAGFWKLSEWLR